MASDRGRAALRHAANNGRGGEHLARVAFGARSDCGVRRAQGELCYLCNCAYNKREVTEG